MRVSRNTVKGAQALLRFEMACLKRGLLLARPIWDVPYDVIVHNREKDLMWRVQVKIASGKPKGSPIYWWGPTHRKSGDQKYASGLIHRWAFEQPDKSGFWLVEGTRVDGRSGCNLKIEDENWENWELFKVAHGEDPTSISA